MHGDRYIEGNKTVMVDFMGKQAAFPVGPINMAARFNVPVSYVFALKETRTHYHFYATPLKTFSFTRNLKLRDQSLGPAVEEYARELEKIGIATQQARLIGLVAVFSAIALLAISG